MQQLQVLYLEFEGVILILWTEFVFMWNEVNSTTIFQLNLGAVEMGKTSKFTLA